MSAAMEDLITHISVERVIADMTRDNIGEGGEREGTITLNLQQADLLAALLLDAYGLTLTTAANGREVSDNLACLAAAFKGESA